MRIAVDVSNVGAGDHPEGLGQFIHSAASAGAQEGHELIFVGSRNAIDAELRASGLAGSDNLSVVDAPTVIGPDEDPAAACLLKPDASILRAAELVAGNSAQALVTTSGTGAAIAGAAWHLKRLRGVLRPALAASLPTPAGTTLLIDAGVNPDSKPWHLLQFALMGALYAHHVKGVSKPSVGLVAPRFEGSGSNELIAETLPLLKYAGLDFRGVIDGKALAQGQVDVAVTDGGTGDICFRLYEGLSSACFEMLESDLGAGFFGRLGGFVAKGTRGGTTKRIGRALQGGCPVLGLGGSVVVCRNPESASAVAGSIRTAAALADSDIRKRIRERLEDIKSDMESARAV